MTMYKAEFVHVSNVSSQLQHRELYEQYNAHLS